MFFLSQFHVDNVNSSLFFIIQLLVGSENALVEGWENPCIKQTWYNAIPSIISMIDKDFKISFKTNDKNIWRHNNYFYNGLKSFLKILLFLWTRWLTLTNYSVPYDQMKLFPSVWYFHVIFVAGFVFSNKFKISAHVN